MDPTKESKNDDNKTNANGHGSNQKNDLNTPHHNSHHTNNKSRNEFSLTTPKNTKQQPQKMDITTTTTIRKIKKFVRCSKKTHLNLRTTASIDDSLQIIILKGSLPCDQLLYIKQHTQYQVRYNEHHGANSSGNNNNCILLLATIPKHFALQFNFKSIASFTQYIINNKFIRFRNRGPTQTKHVSLWRIYQFKGEQTLFNAWIIMKAAEHALGLTPIRNHSSSHVHRHIHKKTKKYKNYHLAAYTSNMTRIDSLGEDILRHIFSFLQGSKFHCWIHIHEIIDRTHHRSNLIGLQFDSNSRNVHVMQRSPSLLKKVRQIGDKFFTKKNGKNSVLTQSFFKKSVEMFKAVY